MTASDYQLDFNGTVIGDGTAWDVVDWGDIEEWATRGSDVTLPTAWGSIPGSSFVDMRTTMITVEATDAAAMLLLEAALLPPANAAPDTLTPIRYKFPNREEFLRYGRCGRRSRTRDVASALGLVRMSFELEFPDPRVYSAVLQQVSLTVFVAGGAALDYTVGAGVDLAFDYTVGSGADLAFEYVGSSSSGLQTITNLGYVATYPLIVFSPATGISSFSLTNQTNGQVLTVNQSVVAGQTLIADMQAAATALGSGGSTSALPLSIGGVSVYGAWSPPRVPLRLDPGPNILKFVVTVGDSTATAAVSAPSGYL